MSRENVVLFLSAVNTKPELRQCLAGKQEIRDWIEAANEAGFEFVSSEFCTVIQTITEVTVTAENAVTEYILARQKIGAKKSERVMKRTFIGGLPRACDPWSLMGTAKQK